MQNSTGSSHGLDGHFSHRPAERYYPSAHELHRGPAYSAVHVFSPRHANLGSHGFTAGHAGADASLPPSPPWRPTNDGTWQSSCVPATSNRHQPGADTTRSSSSSCPGHTAPRSAPSASSRPPPPYSHGWQRSPSSAVHPAGHVAITISNRWSTTLGVVRFAAHTVRFFRPTLSASSVHATR